MQTNNRTKFFAASFLIFTLFAIPVLASQWEQVIKLVAPSSAERNTAVQINFTVWTSTAFSENAAVYTRLENSSNASWQELCLFNTTTINGEKGFTCNPIFNVSAAGNYTIRASVNFNNCGPATPIPNIVSCGDYLDRPIRINNHRDSRFEPLPGRRLGQNKQE